MKARRFWVERKKVVNFYGQLMQFFFQVLYITTHTYILYMYMCIHLNTRAHALDTLARTRTRRSESYYDSNNSMTASDMPGYYSSSQAPDQYSDYMVRINKIIIIKMQSNPPIVNR